MAELIKLIIAPRGILYVVLKGNLAVSKISVGLPSRTLSQTLAEASERF